MSKKIAIFYAIIFIAMLTTSYFYSIVPKSTDYPEIQAEDSKSVLIMPKTSASKVTSIENYTGMLAISSVSISDDGQYIAIGNDKDINMYNKTTSTEMWTFAMIGPVFANEALISGNGKYIVARTTLGVLTQLYFLNTTYSTNKNEMWIYSFTGNINSMDISKDGTKIVAGSDNNNVTLFDNTLSGAKKPIWNYNTTEIVDSVAISADGKFIAAGHGSNVTILDVDQQKAIWIYNTTGTNVKSVDISANGKYIAVAFDKNITYLDSTNKLVLWTYNHPEAVNRAKLSGDGYYILSDANGGYAKAITNVAGLFDKLIEDPKKARWEYGSTLQDIAVSDYGGIALVGHSSTTLGLLNSAESDSKLAIWEYTTENNIAAVDISSTGHYFIVGIGAGKAQLFYYDVPTSSYLYLLGDDDDDDDEEAMIPFGNYYLLFTAIGILSLIVVYKRKLFTNKN